MVKVVGEEHQPMLSLCARLAKAMRRSAWRFSVGGTDERIEQERFHRRTVSQGWVA
jgi:ATP-dependent Lon protease